MTCFYGQHTKSQNDYWLSISFWFWYFVMGKTIKIRFDLVFLGYQDMSKYTNKNRLGCKLTYK